MKTFIQPGNVVTCDSLPYARNSGQGCQWGTMFGVAAVTKAISTACEMQIDGVFTLDATTSQAWADGVALYWDDTTKKATSTASTNIKIGNARGAKGSSAATGAVRLNGAPG